MPDFAPHPCSHPGCGVLTDARHCEAHAVAYARDYERRRGSSTGRGYGRKWEARARAYLQANPLCRACELAGDVEPATEVDHIVPHRSDMMLFWNVTNWQPLCKPCHSRKTALEDGR